MNDEIKEILEALKPHNDIIKEYPLKLSIEEQKLLLDYITNLQKENKHLSKSYAEAILFNQKRCEQNKELQQRIDKAIEYIEDNTYKSYETDYMDLTGIKELLNILNGGDEE